ncbi:hypothetical protein [Pseudoxanthomonas sp. JBR18]|uniref:hypothetical protein n=1 Tax=Pseudoxanthomonas sp. JBR18 TaxID=2969308 RepID=UPI002305787E|nr:hypothetical protein [Pseudoxanthomonas sp. JBR18]WCE03963.1 hypothetical protein PJ250_18085 [Pseudoxanthomonas sp. JBR18]
MRKKEFKAYALGGDGAKELIRYQKILPEISEQAHESVVVLKRETQSKGDEQIGSGILIRTGDRLFLATAQHVLSNWFQPNTPHTIRLSTSFGIFKLAGSAWIAAYDHPIGKEKLILDTAVLEITGELLTVGLEKSLGEIEITSNSHDDLYVMAGYPLKLTTAPILNSTIYGLSIIPTALYGSRRISGQMASVQIGDSIIDDASLAFVYYGMKFENNTLSEMPSIRGISGGAVFRVLNCPLDVDSEIPEKLQLSIAGILIETASRINDQPPLMIATNILVVSEMIKSLASEAARFSWESKQIGRPISAAPYPLSIIPDEI